jgi:SAM-dependent methyltransferase
MDFLFEKLGYPMFKCPACGLVQTGLGKEYESFVRSFYQKGYFTGDPKYGAYAQYEDDKRFITRNMDHHLKRIRKFKKSGKLLDIGCAMGFFMEIAEEAGFESYGFDPSDFALEHAPQYLVSRTKTGTINSVTYPKDSFDVITMLDVFEHLEDPLKDLAKVKSWLKPEGILLIATGYTDSLAAKILHRHWTFYNPPQHLICFNKKGIDTILSRSGFIKADQYTIGKWLSLAYVLHLAMSGAGWGWAKVLSDAVKKTGLESIPVYLPMNDNIAVIARKK